ncbi:MAG: DUF2058 family protein [Pseudomonadota bacterium]
MSNSLRDQLVKAGLATSAQASKAQRQVESEKHAQRRGGGKKKNKNPEQSEDSRAQGSAAASKSRAQQELAKKRAADKARGDAANKKQAERSLRAEMRQLIVANDQRAKTSNENDVPYNFVHNKKIKKIYVPKPQLEQLSKGTLVIVNNDGNYHLVSQEVAQKIRERDPRRIIAAHDDKPPEPGSDDEFYAKFEVPDDLDW